MKMFSPFHRLGYDFRITHAGGRPVASREDYRAALRANGTAALPLGLDSHDVGGPQAMILARAPDFADLEPFLDDTLTVIDPLPAGAFGLPLQSGDRLLHVEGFPVGSIGEIEELETRYPAGSNGIIQWYGLERPGVGQVALVLYRMDWRTHWMLYAAGLMFGILGFVVFGLRPYTRSAWGFLFFCWFFGLFWLLRSIAAQTRTIPEYYVFQFLQVMLPLPAMVLLVTFSPLRLVFPRVAPVAVAFAVYGLGLITINQVMNPGQVYLSRPIFSVWGLSMVAVLLWGMGMDLWLRLRGVYVGTAERLRGRIVRLACLLAFGPVVFHTLFSLWTDIWDFQMWFELCVLLFPLVIGYAIIKHDMLHIREMMAQGAVLFSLLFTFAFLYTQGARLAELLADRIPAIDPAIPQGALLMLLMGGLIVAYGPLRERVHRYFDRADPMLETFANELEYEDYFSLTPREFFTNMLKELSHRGRTPFLSLNLFHPHAGWWLGGKTGMAMLGPTTQECGALFHLMTTSPSEISSEGIADDLRLSGVREQLSRAMKAVKASFAMPLVSENRLLGIMTLGDKEDFRNRTPAELATLRRMAASCTSYVQKQFELAQVSMAGGGDTLTMPGVRPIAMNYPQCPPWIGPYRIEQAIGKGGMAFVFRGKDEDGDSVAIKVPNVMVQHNGEMLRRFMLEGRMMHRMDHPNLMKVVDVGHADREPYLVMPFLEEGSLADRLKRHGRLSEAEARLITAGIARGLQHALLTEHLYHRDIKPANIMLGAGVNPIVADFGLAKIIDATQVTDPSHGAMGTPAYMSPEVCAGKERDWRADQYALGVMLFELLAGERPFHAETFEALAVQHIHQPAPDIRKLRPELSDGIVFIVNRLLRKSPGERFESYAALIEALEQGDPGEETTLAPGAMAREGTGSGDAERKAERGIENAARIADASASPPGPVPRPLPGDAKSHQT